MTATEHVILVNEEDIPQGSAEKLLAHKQGLCHRAFSVFIYRQQVTTEILLQQRANDKYHSPGLWTNTCCSHPRPDEDIVQAGERRLFEEMGIQASLKWIGQFHYIAHFENGLTENEVDHVLIGQLSNPSFHVNSAEVQAFRWISLEDLQKEISLFPQKFTPWLKEALSLVKAQF